MLTSRDSVRGDPLFAPSRGGRRFRADDGGPRTVFIVLGKPGDPCSHFQLVGRRLFRSWGRAHHALDPWCDVTCADRGSMGLSCSSLGAVLWQIPSVRGWKASQSSPVFDSAELRRVRRDGRREGLRGSAGAVAGSRGGCCSRWAFVPLSRSCRIRLCVFDVGSLMQQSSHRQGPSP